MIKTESFKFDNKGRITLFQPVNAQRVLKVCMMHAKRRRGKQPTWWALAYMYAPTLTNVVG